MSASEPENVKPPIPQDVSCRESTLDVKDYWEFRWQYDYIGWHQKTGNKYLMDYMNEHYLKTVQDTSQIRVFVPLCGKSQDMIRLYELGFTVVGVEYAPKAIDEFFSENSIPTLDNPKYGTGDKVFAASADGRLIIGHGDLFTFTPESLPFTQYDLIWDRGSLEALNLADRPKYSNLMLSLLKSDGVYLTDTKDYDITQYGGPPLKANTEDLQKLYGDRCSVEEVYREDMLALDNPSREKWWNRGITNYMFGVTHVIRKLSKA